MARAPFGLDRISLDGIADDIDRRSLLIGGGVGAGLLVGWWAWPRSYQPNLAVSPKERLFNAFLKIDTIGQIIVVVPQLEMGQGVTTVLPQILADELGADWRTVAVQSAPVSPLYANSLLAEKWMESGWSGTLAGAGSWAMQEYARRHAIMLTGANDLAMFGDTYREAGAAARVLLCKAAAAQWDVTWESCDIHDGIVTDGKRKARIAELAEDAINFALPEILPMRQGRDHRLLRQDVPRLDTPSKLDGSHNFAADIRIPNMAFASIRQGPVGAVRLKSLKEDAAAKINGFVRIVKTEDWVAAVGSTWWAANRALDALDPVFELSRNPMSSASMDRTLDEALKGEDAKRIFHTGDVDEVVPDAKTLRANFSVAPALHLAIEPPCATAWIHDGRAEIWVATQAPAFCRRVVAEALGMAEEQVVIYPVSAGGSFDRRFDHDAAVQAALIAQELERPVQLMWSRLEEVIQDRPRPPAKARLTANLTRGGTISTWSAKIAAPAAISQTWRRIAEGENAVEAMNATGDSSSALALSGAWPPYNIANVAIDHAPCNIGLPTGAWRGNADSYTSFFTECFMDELAQQARVEPMSYRIQMLGGNPRLARCLTTAAAMGGWQGGIAGSGQGIACHQMDGSFIALLAEVAITGGRVAINRLVCAADCGDQPHPDIARQQIEGGLMFALSAAIGHAPQYAKGMPRRALMGRLGLPRLSDIGEVSVQLIESNEVAGAVGQIGVPVVAPAIANALYTITGMRYRSLPLSAGG